MVKHNIISLISVHLALLESLATKYGKKLLIPSDMYNLVVSFMCKIYYLKVITLCSHHQILLSTMLTVHEFKDSFHPPSMFLWQQYLAREMYKSFIILRFGIFVIFQATIPEVYIFVFPWWVHTAPFILSDIFHEFSKLVDCKLN